MKLFPFLFSPVSLGSVWNSTLTPFSVEDALGEIAEDSLFSPERPLSAFGRVVEQFSDDQIRKLDSRIAALLAHRIQRDEALEEFTPQFTNMYERSPAIDRIDLGERAAVSDEALVFFVANKSDIFIKYMHDCSGKDTGRSFPHPLLMEAWLTAHAATLNLSPRVYFVSPPARLPTTLESSPKTAFQLNPVEQLDCFLQDTTVRFSIFERTHGKSLNRLLNEGHLGGVKHAARIAITLFKGLQALHSLEIVHGDLGIDRITMVQDPGNRYRLFFVNFSMASYTDRFGFATRDRPRVRSLRHAVLQSFWEHAGGEGYRYTQRDDLFRAMQIVADVLSPDRYIADQINMVNSGNLTELMAWKQFGNLFQSPRNTTGHIPFTSIGQLVYQQIIRLRLLEIQAIVRNCPPKVPASVYQSLVEKFTSILTHHKLSELLDTSEPVTTTTQPPPAPASRGHKRVRFS